MAVKKKGGLVLFKNKKLSRKKRKPRNMSDRQSGTRRG
jgi:hypothetical protein